MQGRPVAEPITSMESMTAAPAIRIPAALDGKQPPSFAPQPGEHSAGPRGEHATGYEAEHAGGYTGEQSAEYAGEHPTGYADEHPTGYAAGPGSAYPAEGATAYLSEGASAHPAEHGNGYGADHPDGHGGGRRPVASRWMVAAATVLLVGAAVAAAIVAPRLLSRSDQPAAATATATATPVSAATTPGAAPAQTDMPSTTDTTNTTDPTAPIDTATVEPTTAQPTAVGIVTIDPGVGDARAADVAAMFDTYFGGINDKDYGRVGSVLDPAGSVDPSDAAQMKSLARGTRSTTDSNVVLTGLGDQTGGGLLTADVTFVSHQNPGDGPRGRSGETCTEWTIHYTVSDDGAYRIRDGKAGSRPC